LPTDTGTPTFCFVRLDLGGSRFTHDTLDTPSQRDELLANLCADLEISPLHGRSESHLAHVTSRCIDASL